MTDQQIITAYNKASHALLELKTVALEPSDIAQMVNWSGVLTKRIAELVDICLSEAAGKMLVDDGEATNR